MKIVLGTMTFGGQVDKTTVQVLLKHFRERGHLELDTAFVYNAGATETLLGELVCDGVLGGLPIAGKANPAEFDGLTRESVTQQLEVSLERLSVDSLDLFYLHAPDLNTPVEQTLEAVAALHQAGRFQRFGLSNYAAWQVSHIVSLCEQHGWPRPVIYQGMYNALTRDVERELFPCLAEMRMGFYAYNPLAGGLLSGKHLRVQDSPSAGRFAGNESYQQRYWKPEYFDMIAAFAACAREHDIAPAAAALRWLRHHSALTTLGVDPGSHGIILGASSEAHLVDNLAACEAGPLPQAVIDALDNGWEAVRPACIKYFRP